jgi:hypothetical protein
MRSFGHDWLLESDGHAHSHTHLVGGAGLHLSAS